MKAIQINKLSISFGEQQVIDDLSLELEEAETVILLGPSGSGKTTLLRCIAGLERFKAGEIFLFEKKVQDKNHFIPPAKRKIGMVFQDLILFPHLTVLQNVDFVSRALFKDKVERASWNLKVLQKMRIEHKMNKYPHELSGGEKQRVAIARAIAHRPKILLLDEPFSHLDNDLREKILWDLLKMIRSDNLTCLIASHEHNYFDQSVFAIYTLIKGSISE